MKTLREKYQYGLEKMGFKSVPTRSSKFMVMEGELKTRDGSMRTVFMFLGRSGSLRIGQKATVADTIPVSDSFKTRVLEKVVSNQQVQK